MWRIPALVWSPGTVDAASSLLIMVLLLHVALSHVVRC